MCEYADQLRRVRHELETDWGNGIVDYPKLKNLLNQALEGHHHDARA